MASVIVVMRWAILLLFVVVAWLLHLVARRFEFGRVPALALISWPVLGFTLFATLILRNLGLVTILPQTINIMILSLIFYLLLLVTGVGMSHFIFVRLERRKTP